MKPGGTLYAYAGRKTGKLYPGELYQHPVTARVALRQYLKYEPNPETGGYIHRTDQELNALQEKFKLMTYRISADGTEE